MKWTFITFFAFATFYGCQDKSTPTIYPSKIGVDSAYADLIKKDKPVENKACHTIFTQVNLILICMR